jgi:hypothetical protein
VDNVTLTWARDHCEAGHEQAESLAAQEPSAQRAGVDDKQGVLQDVAQDPSLHCVRPETQGQNDRLLTLATQLPFERQMDVPDWQGQLEEVSAQELSQQRTGLAAGHA